jgi:hypothetical protein
LTQGFKKGGKFIPLKSKSTLDSRILGEIFNTGDIDSKGDGLFIINTDKITDSEITNFNKKFRTGALQIDLKKKRVAVSI